MKLSLTQINHIKNDQAILKFYLHVGNLIYVFPWHKRSLKLSGKIVLSLFMFLTLHNTTIRQIRMYEEDGEPTDQFLNITICVFENLFTVMIWWDLLQGKEEYKHLLRNLALADRKLAKSATFKLVGKFHIGVMIVTHGIYLFIGILTSVLAADYVEYLDLICFFLLFYQVIYTVILYEFLSDCLVKRYDALCDVLKSINKPQVFILQDRFLEIRCFMEVYKILHDTVIIINSLFGKVQLIMFMTGFFHLLSALSTVIFHKAALDYNVGFLITPICDFVS